MAKAIMVQGTMSNAGKSLLTAGLCRIFRQDGYRVAPFKSQNMALNSFITREGLEMGRAQVVQAQAAGIEPLADMNPILLKPSSDIGSQVIVHGVPVATMAAKDYFLYKKSLIPEILAAYGRLDREYDIIVIEGAGSPAEINLKRDDIVNMGMARLAGAPVLLAGDIDRGGVFAQLYGTVMLLEPEERSMIKGMVINKFRGDKTLLDPGVAMIEELCGIPVVGVAPYMDVDIEDEDSLGDHLNAGAFTGPRGTKHEGAEAGFADIAVIRFPRISNFTDFHVFSAMQGVSLRYVDRLSQLGKPDLILLPGTKNTISDLMWMRQNGLEAAVKKAAAAGIPVWGVCGGYQMMGRKLTDESGTEDGVAGRCVTGMDLLPAATVFHGEKQRTRITGQFQAMEGIFKNLSGMKVEGYEIHMGSTEIITAEKAQAGKKPPGSSAGETTNPFPLLILTEYQNNSGVRKADGMMRGNLYGTYVHGIFDNPGIAASIADAILSAKGLSAFKSESGAPDYHAYREMQYDKLAGELRKNLDMEKIYKILEEGV